MATWVGFSMDAKQSFRAYWLDQVAQSRGVMLAVGLVCAVLGGVALLLPKHLFGWVVGVIGGILIASGVFKGAQLVLGARSRARRKRGWPLIVLQVLVDLALGVIVLRHRALGASVLSVVFMVLFVVEAGILFVMGTRAPTVRVRLILWATAAAILFLAVTSVLCVRTDPAVWVSVVIGLKLLVFGAALLSIVWAAPKAASDVYDEGSLEPIVGELYAVYFGAAFHLGVFVGEGHVVHYLDDNHVWHVTWEKFLEGRCPHHWSYPDLPEVPAETVVATALAEVGKEYPYSFLKHNCEHFAIYCKSGGTTQFSKYAQVPGSFNNVAVHPFVGMIAELNTRIVEYLAFHLGGPSGKQLSLAIRRMGSIITMWLISGKDRKQEQAGRAGSTS